MSGDLDQEILLFPCHCTQWRNTEAILRNVSNAEGFMGLGCKVHSYAVIFMRRILNIIKTLLTVILKLGKDVGLILWSMLAFAAGPMVYKGPVQVECVH